MGMLQALSLLAELLNSGDVQQQLHQSGSDLAMSAAVAGAYLVELLEMRTLRHTFMVITDPNSFYRAAVLLPRGATLCALHCCCLFGCTNASICVYTHVH